MSIIDKLEKLSPGLKDIRDALKTKQVTMPTSAKVREVPDYIRKLEKKGPVYLMSGTKFNSILSSYKSYIKKIIFTDIEPPSTAADISRDSKKNLWGWRENDTYYISGKKREIYITDMGYMFQNLTNLVSIDFGEVNTKQNTTMIGTFYGCTKLTELLNFSKLNTSRVSNMNSTFYNCSSLEDIDLSGFDTYLVRDMHYMFYGCSKITEFNAQYFETNLCYDMSGMFYGCTSLENMDLNNDNWKFSSVTTVDHMFYNCSSLKSISFASSLNSTNVTTMAYMFYGCSELKSLNLNAWKVNRLENVSYLLYNCSSLTTFTRNSSFGAYLKYMQYMFYGCKSVTSLDFSLSTHYLSGLLNVNNMFNGCSSLQTLDITGFSGLYKIEVGGVNRMFYGCTNLKTIYAETWVLTYNITYNILNSTEVFTNCTSLKGGISYQSKRTSGFYCRCNGGYFTNNYYRYDADLASGSALLYGLSGNQIMFTNKLPDNENIRISDLSYDHSESVWGFVENNTLYISNPNGGKIYANENCSYMFNNVSANSVKFENLDTSKVSDMSYMFYKANISSIDISSFKLDNVRTMENMFNSSTVMTLTLPTNPNLGRLTTTYSMFYMCRYLSSVDMRTWNFTPTTTGYMFFLCDSLRSVNLSSIQPQSTNIEAMFYGCTSLVTIYAYDWNYYYTPRNSDWVFYTCLSLRGGISYDYNKYSGEYACYTNGYFTRP